MTGRLIWIIIGLLIVGFALRHFYIKSKPRSSNEVRKIMPEYSDGELIFNYRRTKGLQDVNDEWQIFNNGVVNYRLKSNGGIIDKTPGTSSSGSYQISSDKMAKIHQILKSHNFSKYAGKDLEQKLRCCSCDEYDCFLNMLSTGEMNWRLRDKLPEDLEKLRKTIDDITKA